MALYSFRARDQTGRAQAGTLEAAHPSGAALQLRQRGWLVVQVQPTREPRTLSAQLSAWNPLQWLPPRSVEIELSCKQLTLMLRGGLTLLTSLEAVAEQTGRPTLRAAWREVATRLQEGSSFASALAGTGRFPQLLVQLARVGEQTGQLESTIEKAAETLENRRRIRTSLLTALAYPSVVLVAATGVTLFMVLGVIPKLKTFLSGLGRRLPPMTQTLLDVTDWAREHLLATGIVMGAIAVTIAAVYLNPGGRRAIDRILLRIPVVGNMLRLAGTASFARGLGVLLKSGITVLEGLRTTEDLMANRFLADRIAHTRETVMQGASVSVPLAAPHAFSPMLARMVAVGEASGTLDEVLDEVARFHESQLQATIRTFSAIIEPVIILLVGSVVGFVYIAFFLALFSAGGL